MIILLTVVPINYSFVKVYKTAYYVSNSWSGEYLFGIFA